MARYKIIFDTILNKSAFSLLGLALQHHFTISREKKHKKETETWETFDDPWEANYFLLLRCIRLLVVPFTVDLLVPCKKVGGSAILVIIPANFSSVGRSAGQGRTSWDLLQDRSGHPRSELLLLTEENLGSLPRSSKLGCV